MVGPNGACERDFQQVGLQVIVLQESFVCYTNVCTLWISIILLTVSKNCYCCQDFVVIFTRISLQSALNLMRSIRSISHCSAGERYNLVLDDEYSMYEYKYENHAKVFRAGACQPIDYSSTP